MPNLQLIDFHDQRPMPLDEAAELAGKSISWIRRHRQFGPLEPVEVDGRQAVTAGSLAAFLAKRREALRSRRLPKRPAHLRLVVDNSGK